MTFQKADANSTYSRVACIGTGFGGIGVGATLKRWYNCTDIAFFDRSHSCAGVWANNTYPGCVCDIPAVLYSFSYEQNPDWSRLVVPQREIKDYLEGVAKKHDLLSKMHFRTEVEECKWDEAESLWTLSVYNMETGLRYFHRCQVLFNCSGGLTKPRELKAPGVDTFKGRIFHCAQWDHTYDFRGKRVVVIGNGCTGTQVVPALANNYPIANLTHLIRSKHYIFHKTIDFAYSDRLKWMFRHIPGMQTMHRYFIYRFVENHFGETKMDETGAAMRAERRKESVDYIIKTAPAEYRDLLIPEWEVGCRRRIYSADYVECLSRSDVQLSNSPILRIESDGISTEAGFIPADVIILANGYDMNNAMQGMKVYGKNGAEISDRWKAIGGPTAYGSVSVSSFPNFFFINGPNSGSGHTSLVIGIESATNLALRIIKPILDGRAAVVEPDQKAQTKWTDRVQKAAKETVWMKGGCANWYVDGEWCGTLWPFTTGEMLKRSFLPDWEDWLYKTAKGSNYTHWGNFDRFWKTAAGGLAMVSAGIWCLSR